MLDITIPSGCYLNIDHLLDQINKITINGKEVFKFVTNKAHVHFTTLWNNARLKFSPLLALQLGFLPQMEPSFESKANSLPNLTLGIPKSLFCIQI
jgi:hypothetical protein